MRARGDFFPHSQDGRHKGMFDTTMKRQPGFAWVGVFLPFEWDDDLRVMLTHAAQNKKFAEIFVFILFYFIVI